MASFAPKRTRSERIASLGFQPGRLARLIECLRRSDVLLRLGMCLLAAACLWGVTEGWRPPFPFRSGQVPRRDIVARVEFKVKDDDATRELKRHRRMEMPCVYDHDGRTLLEFRQGLKERLFHIVRAESFDKLAADFRQEFFPATENSTAGDPEKSFADLKESLANDMDLSNFERALAQTLADWERDGLLEELEHKPAQGSSTAIQVQPVGDQSARRPVNVNDVRILQALAKIEKRLPDELRTAKLPEQFVVSTAATLVQWMRTRLPKTLKLNEAATKAEWLEIEKRIDQNPEFRTYAPGTSLAVGNVPIRPETLALLAKEHNEQVKLTGLTLRIIQSIASFGLYIALYVLCGVYIYFRQPDLLCNLRRFATLLSSVVVTVAACWMVSHDHWRAEIIPLILFGMTVAIAYEQELSLLLIASVSLVVTLTLGQGLTQFVVLAASAAASVLMIGRIRSRTRLIYVGLMVGIVALLTSLGVCVLTGQAYGAPNVFGHSLTEPDTTNWASPFATSLLTGAAWAAICSVFAGLLMTAILPAIEKIFDVQTDISLLVMGDAATPLLQELVRRAPGTYNHSINVASIGEAAAEAIGANGLLVRVGAYFHDIGKMLKPAYYIENQGQDVNRHQSLLPAMSTLVIIAHVKDGANLARQHGLPQSIIDFIEQHHGTTLVEYFYRQAAKQSEADPDASEVDETSFRYPGPKPQTKETAVMMLADAVESASRTLVDPTPSRIENLVRDIAMKRLLDGQFEECGLTLQELHMIEESLVKSLTAVYHGRVKYPDQQPV